MIPRDTEERILDAAQIVNVVGDFVSLRRRGSDFVACCPFHQEKTPSFHVNPARGMYHCFGCHEKGTAVGFLMKHENMSYPEALRYLAKKYGIEVVEKEESAEDLAAKTRRESLHLVLEFAADFFVRSLATDEGRTIGLAYFHSRGLEDSTIAGYGLGWAPKSRTALYDAAKAKGYKEEYLLETGLCIRYDDGRIVDRFYDRVIFPIYNHGGRVVGFGGRTLSTDKKIAKYVNSSASEIYDKSTTLYGIKHARNSMAREDRCYLVEGYLDVLSLHQLGITNAVASSGTALTKGQIRLIRKFTDNVTIMYDGDMPGIKAALKGINLLLQEGLRVKVVLIPDGDDPDSYSRKHTLAEVRAFISSHEEDFLDFKAGLLSEDAGSDPLKRADMINEMADTIALIQDPVTRSVYAQNISMRFSLDQAVIGARINKVRRKMVSGDERFARKDAGIPDKAFPLSGNVPQEPQAEAIPPVVPEPGEEDRDEAVAVPYPQLKPVEDELLGFILRYGLDTMNFESDSPYYDPGQQTTVAAFISVNLAELELEFLNPVHKRTYDAYFNLYDNCPELDQNAIARSLADGEDREMAALVTDLVLDRYDLSVRSLADSMTALSTQLVKFVPRTILTYKLVRVKMKASDLNRRLKVADPSQVEAILIECQEITETRKELEKALGRIR